MPSVEYKKINIASKMLETALKLFLEDKDYFSALHLAGACEEILGKQIEFLGKETSIESNIKAIQAIKKTLSGIDMTDKDERDTFNSAKNSIKHMRDGNDSTITMDPEYEAEEMLSRALTNWNRLGGYETPLMEKFFNNQEKKYVVI